MKAALEAAFPAVEWKWNSDAVLTGRNRRTWLSVQEAGRGYRAFADLELRGEGWAETPEEAVRLACADLGAKWRDYAERVVDAMGKWGQP